MKNVLTVFSTLCLFALTRSEPPSTGYGAPQGGSSYGPPKGGGDYTHDANPYEFGYKVKDDYSGSKFHQQEASDGNQVRGEYRVELPDGRTQIVTYWADWQTGFHADVKYEGKAKFPPNPPKYGPPNGAGGGNGGYNYPAPSAPGTSYGAP